MSEAPADLPAEAVNAAAKAIATADIEGNGVPDYRYLAKVAVKAALPHLTAKLQPFQTRDWFGNLYQIHHGEVAIDVPTDVTLVPVRGLVDGEEPS